MHRCCSRLVGAACSAAAMPCQNVIVKYFLLQDSAHEQGDSEYESADDDIEIIEEIIRGENGSGEEPYPGVERQEGDGEETPSSPTTLDDDEDKKNPAYIPKRGMFYEHDDRIDPADEEEESKEEEKEKEKDKKKKVWKADASERWGHDKFMEMEQTPKNEDELVAAYGYDIRNEDAAPRARRRRRYGRGPNKYTRSWKDEDAYVKPAPAKPVPLKPGVKPGKSVKIEDSNPIEHDDEREPLKREKSMTEMKSTLRPELKREKSAPEIRMNKLNRNSRERDDESFRNRKSDGYYNNRGSDFGGRGFGGGPNRGRGRGGRGGFDDRDQFRGRGGHGRGGFDDRHRGGGDRRLKDDRGYQGDRHMDNDFRGRGRGGGRGRGRGDGGDRRHMDQVKTEDLGNDLNNLDINEKEREGGHDRRGMRYSQQRRGDRGGSEHERSTSASLQEMYAEGIDPSLCSGPPSAPPFQNQVSSSRLSHSSVGPAGAVTQNTFIGPGPGPGHSNQPILNYGGPQFPVGPVPSTLVTAIPNLAGTITTGVGMPIMAADPNMMIPDQFADVRGGVTYFNPTAQNFLPQRQVTKRAKAPIAIVDPSQKGGDMVAAKDYTNSMNNRSLPGESNLNSENELTAAQ